MRWVEPYPFRAHGGLVLERSVKRRVYGGEVEAAHGRAGYAVAAHTKKKKRIK